ncbi:MAG: hypothetical protein ACYDD4_08530 [Acidimicrobiales bacterium]
MQGTLGHPVAPWAPLVPVAPEGKTRSMRSWGAVAGAVVVVAAGVGTSVALASKGSSGAATPAQAVTDLLGAAQHADVLGILDTLVPAERDALRDGLTNTVSQLSRLGILSSNVSLSNVGGLTLAFHGVKTSTTFLRQDLAAVRVTGGTSDSRVDEAELPLGSFTRSLLGSRLDSVQSKNGNALAGGNGAVVTEEVGGSWYVSLGYTIAEAARHSSGAALPDASASVPPQGSATADDAVRSFFDALTSLNATSMVAVTPPEEMAALHDYAALFLPRAQAVLDGLKQHVTITIDSMQFGDIAQGAGTELVQIKQLGFTVKFGTTTITKPATGCVTLSNSADPSTNQTLCPGQLSQQQQSILSALPSGLQQVITHLQSSHPVEGFVAVDEGGQWYVDPVRTLFTDVDNLLGILTPNDLKDIRDGVSQIRSGTSASG